METEIKLKEKVYSCDFAVIGAGLAGISAALSASRAGQKVVLVTDRPILGGSASSEIRVGPGGADYACYNRYAKETGIVEEFFNHIAYRAQNAGKWRWFDFDQVYFDLVYSEPNITLLLNTLITEVETADSNITCIKGFGLRQECQITIKAKIYADCSGDGTVGYLAGNSYRIGAEARSEFNETYCEDEPNPHTMGATLLFTSKDAGHKTEFKTPSWAIDIKTLPSFNRIRKSINTMPDGSYYGFWWVEYGGMLGIENDNETIEHLRRLVNGIWGHIKNSGLYPEAENQVLNWMGYLPGKRESRRLMGKYIINSNDLFSQKKFDNTIGYTGWPVDVHEPEGYLSEKDGYTHYWLRGISDIPITALIAKDIDNLVFAGRDISCTREALGSLRLISTTSVMGQAVGELASLAIENNATPFNVASENIKELQRRLLRKDQSIVGMALIEKENLAQNAKITASSENDGCAEKIDGFIIAERGTGLIIPCERLESLELYLAPLKKETKAQISIYECDERLENYRFGKLIKSTTLKVDSEKWYKTGLDVVKPSGGKVFVYIAKNPDLKLYYSKKHYCGITSFICDAEKIDSDSSFYVFDHNTNTPKTFCYRAKGLEELFKVENVANGHIRPLAKPNMWMSKKLSSNGEFVQFDFDKKQTVKSIELIFNSDLNSRRMKPVINCVNPEMVRSFDIEALDGEWKSVFTSDENFLRFCNIKLDKAISCQGLRVRVRQTWGSDSAEIFEIRIY